MTCTTRPMSITATSWIAGTEWEQKSLEDIVRGTYQSGAVAQNGIFNNISQLWNHNMFWTRIPPARTRRSPARWKRR